MTDFFSLNLRPPPLASNFQFSNGIENSHISIKLPSPDEIENTSHVHFIEPGNIDRAMKILIIGNSKCGKSSIIKRYTANIFDSQYKTTVGADFIRKDILWRNDSRNEKVGIRLQLWDLAGQDRMQCITRAYFARAKGVVIVCDVSREGTVNAIRNWKEEVDVWREKSENGAEIPVVLFANKSDLLGDPQEAFRAGASVERVCREVGFTSWWATSAKTGEGIEQGFQALVGRIMESEGQGESAGAGGQQGPPTEGWQRGVNTPPLGPRLRLRAPPLPSSQSNYEYEERRSHLCW